MKLKNILLSILIVILLFTGGFYFYKLTHKNIVPTPANFSVNIDQNIQTIPDKNTSSDVVSTKKELPKSVKISVPFLSQAPLVNWDALHEDACEEASLIIVKHFLDKTNIDSVEIGDGEIKDLVSYEEKNNYGLSITLDELNKIAKNYYKIKNGVVKNNITIDSIKTELSLGHPVIVPAAGKILANPNFTNGGPNYHMLVITGYDENGFITNDPGTRKGQNFRYSFDNLFNAIHDLDATNILNGQKSFLVFE